jgi:hypothetical protein
MIWKQGSISRLSGERQKDSCRKDPQLYSAGGDLNQPIPTRQHHSYIPHRLKGLPHIQSTLTVGDTVDIIAKYHIIVKIL